MHDESLSLRHNWVYEISLQKIYCILISCSFNIMTQSVFDIRWKSNLQNRFDAVLIYSIFVAAA
jgi:hypothetical protein